MSKVENDNNVEKLFRYTEVTPTADDPELWNFFYYYYLWGSSSTYPELSLFRPGNPAFLCKLLKSSKDTCLQLIK